MMALDYMGTFPLSKKGNRQLLVVIDLFSKFVWLHPMKKATAEDTVKFLREQVFRKYGVPNVMISDNGPQLKSTVFQTFLQRHNVEHWPTSAYHPQANATEAANKTILNAIRAYIVKENHRDWDRNLTDIACAYNSATHSITKFSPYMILYGLDMPLSGERNACETENNELAEKLKIIREKVLENLKKAFDNNKRRYDMRSRDISFNIGDVVWKRNTELSNAANYHSAKLAPRFVKCKIQKKIGSNTYALTDDRGKYIGNFSASDLKN